MDIIDVIGITIVWLAMAAGIYFGFKSGWNRFHKKKEEKEPYRLTMSS